MSDRPIVQLSNLAIDRAEAAGEQWRRYGASRRESIEAYIAAGAALLEGIAEVPHGGKGAFYRRAGIPADTAERMLILARAGMTADAVMAGGGIRAVTDQLRRRIDPATLREHHLVRLIVRQGADCAICRKRLPEDGAMIDIDHVEPKAWGGTDDVENLQAVCHGCNLRKGARLPAQRRPASTWPAADSTLR